VLQDILSFAQEAGFHIRDLIKIAIVRPKGQCRILVWLDLQAETSADIPALVEKVLANISQ